MSGIERDWPGYEPSNERASARIHMMFSRVRLPRPLRQFQPFTIQIGRRCHHTATWVRGSAAEITGLSSRFTASRVTCGATCAYRIVIWILLCPAAPAPPRAPGHASRGDWRMSAAANTTRQYAIRPFDTPATAGAAAPCSSACAPPSCRTPAARAGGGETSARPPYVAQRDLARLARLRRAQPSIHRVLSEARRAERPDGAHVAATDLGGRLVGFVVDDGIELSERAAQPPRRL
jgi:hypothetical protein